MKSITPALLIIANAALAGEGLVWQPPAHFPSLKPITFKIEEFPSDSFLLIFPEWLTSREKSWHVRPEWQTEGGEARGSWVSDGVALRLMLRYEPGACGSRVEWEYQVSNRSGQDLAAAALFNCVNLVDAPAFRDLGMVRTWIRNGHTNTRQLSAVEKTKAPRAIQFYPAKGGLHLPDFERFMRYGATNLTVLEGDRIAVDSVDGKWTLESIVDGQAAYFFNNWESTHGCIHAAPLLGDIQSGQSASSTGRLVLRKL
jgi:hypothetical protein